ncbi:16S rRNA (uracil(1498)-N(3))-methyltransferase [Flavobacterium sp. CYK-55]|uniref:16S rRNA (uracil(1498)-N(3))-methyltransferase n=1 Tax=Flavobacterium sp. CYK-55 TaxID=2835529 RepID=UPI001BCD0B00|nr:16S rRNA (uracil(1498)-N(3))-methyltransferase [Flavobacterium sp. CYK-55]MBS7786799.1 16S rRNA (uracil(1498)-N(3))-methyltransferase [Flavobacterium sp. CYK-55]
MQLFYNPAIGQDQEGFSFDKEESRHIVKVLRKKEGDKLYVTNGLGELFETEITLATDHKCQVKIIRVEHVQPKKYQLHLAVAPTKMNDRYEWFLEKATEIGIDQITPIFCDHSERKNFNHERMEKIIISALKQSNQYSLPRLNQAITFKEFIQQKKEGLNLIAHCEETQRKSLKEILQPNTDVTLLIGPEGDFSSQEIEMALKADYIPVTLGQTRLRTETAALVGCHSVVFCNEQTN